MTTDTRSAAAQWAKTHTRFHCPRRTKVPAWDAYGGAKVVATETNVKHARTERPLGDILIAEGDTFWANPDTPKIRELVGAGRIVALAPTAPTPDGGKVHGDGVDTVLDNRRLVATLRGMGIDTPDQLAAAYVGGELRGKPGIGKAFLAEIGEALVTEGLILAEDLA
jgi:hypothetical protein